MKGKNLTQKFRKKSEETNRKQRKEINKSKWIYFGKMVLKRLTDLLNINEINL